MSDWQPIETAPKDGTFILAVVAGFTPAVARWEYHYGEGSFEYLDPESLAAYEHFQAYIDSSDPWAPTHWMPLPEPLK